ncbi:hypothetical protein NQ176_g5844 [Zarea fungicola]|uniref:Uncharacterized protein n=1 Tax=Zarea fungicola TaxID=93591 RepID=A0ACC1N6D2_9HYPO|nr:hypothetical protein NQ176_g5844 [Lecanicillium fungicola]
MKFTLITSLFAATILAAPAAPAPDAAGAPSFPAGMGSVYHHLLHARPERAFFNVLEYYGDEGVPLVGASVAVSESFINGMETYNVLWIEKTQDIYTRKGVGRILKSDWVAQKPERIDLLLM